MCVGPLRNLCHWGPLTALGIIKIISFMTIHCNSLWWPPSNSLSGLLNSSAFLICSALTIYNFLSSIYEGPGNVPLNWSPSKEDDKKCLQFCFVCQGYKAPRSHHCKKCGKCVLKMDHHCPWINNCVGHRNHCNFTLFLFFAVCGCSLSTVTLSCCTYRALYRTWYYYYGDPAQPVVSMEVYTFIACVFALGLSIGVVLAVGMLLFFQLRAIIRNRTAIEDWILEKAEHRRRVAEAQGEELKPFIFPYNLGLSANIRQVLNFNSSPVGDGISWPLCDHPDCNEFTLTLEQIAQKNEKRQRTKAYTAVRSYSGRWLPVVHGWRVCCTPPCTDEHRLPLEPGDYLLVTRWRRHWIFGEKTSGASGDSIQVNIRGWFPRCCVICVTGDLTDKPKQE